MGGDSGGLGDGVGLSDSEVPASVLRGAVRSRRRRHATRTAKLFFTCIVIFSTLYMRREPFGIHKWPR